MSWTDIFPVFTEEQLDDFHAAATPSERRALDEWYGVDRILNPQPEKAEIISVSLFWKNVRAGDPELPTPTLDLLKNAVELGYAKRFNPWDHYVLPLLEQTPAILSKNPKATLRVHLAQDLKFLADHLVEAGCEVRLMKSSSINFAPGGLWRFLPFSEEVKTVTVTDTDRLNEVESDLLRTRTMVKAGLAAWRVPVPVDLTGDFRVCYLPFMGCQFGVQGGLIDVRELLDAFTWHALHDRIDPHVLFPNCGPLPIQSHTWPSYGFDEFFMNVAAYPRLAQGGMHTYIPGSASSQLLTLDVEYCTWGNPNSEVVYFPTGSCCGQAPVGQENPHPSEAAGPLPAPVPPETTAETASAAHPPKVAFLFLTKGDLHQSGVWKEYLDEAGTDAALFAHVKNHPELSAESLLANHLIEKQIPTEWADLSLVEATLHLLEAALQDQSATHFALVSESCVPIRPFCDLKRSLTLDSRSRLFVRSWEDERKVNVLRAQRVENLNGIRKELAHFQAQWMCLNRSDAQLIVDNPLLQNFAGTFAPDEAYFATALSVLGRPPLHSVANRHFTWTDWTQSVKNPRLFDHVSPQLAALLIESGCFFARKFSPDSNIAEYALHQAGTRSLSARSDESPSDATSRSV